MGKQQTAGQIKGEWHSRRKEVVSMWPKLRKQTGYASLLCLPHIILMMILAVLLRPLPSVLSG